MGGRSKKRAASVISVAARKRQLVDGLNTDNDGVNNDMSLEQSDSEGESCSDQMVSKTQHELQSCQNQVAAMAKLINVLKVHVEQQDKHIESLQTKLDFLMSAMGLSDDLPASTSFNFGQVSDCNSTVTPSTADAAGQASHGINAQIPPSATM